MVDLWDSCHTSGVKTSHGSIGDSAMPDLPAELVKAVESGTVTRGQLIQLIELEANAIGLTIDNAIAQARENKLPENTIGADLAFLIDLLEAKVSA
jgi:hypothetical protein